ncbi:MAG: UDP-N-acetylmuramoyl-L-alanyl-D-glutamate--2,6-diaminopimelate ligase [Peptococcaceae bacterium]|nr:UDP-N-acetylmuramoyl-L-alanyl-D-glutamate--2,6-diaminopimelate ligase [Peptococcaceae bacterium]
MKLKEAVNSVDGVIRWRKNLAWEAEIGRVTADSRQVGADDVFIAARGEKHDGHHYIEQALTLGAKAVILEDESHCRPAVPWILVKNSRRALGQIMHVLAGRPSLGLNVIGVTGTNGKTTVTHMIAAILAAARQKVGLLGTIHNRIGDRESGAGLTTADSPELAALFQRMVAENMDYAVMEVSSHALAQSRVAGIVFDLAVFTNLSQDHLDFHHTMEEYLSEKAKLFAELRGQGEKNRKKAAILNLDDPASDYLADYCQVPVITYGLSPLSHVRAEGVSLSPAGLDFSLVFNGQRFPIHSRLQGRFNVYNSLAAIAAALVEGVPMPVIQAALAAMPPVPGRFQRVESERPLPFAVFVDYSHTPDSLENCLATGRELCQGRVIAIFGAGGHRDRGKRPLMGEAAARLADICIITSDNPRDEEPLSIIRDVQAGMGGPTGRAKILTEPDRREAIGLGIALAREGDVVLICGKGHENYQIVGEEKLPFDDYTEALAAIRERERACS